MRVDLLFCQAERSNLMTGLENIIYILDNMLDTRRKRHITGGILLSISMLFGGLAFTAMTIKNEEDKDEF